MAMHCPKCEGEIAEADVNVGANVAFCRVCDEAFALSLLAKGVLVNSGGDPAAMFQAPTEVVDISNPPKGCSYADDGMEVVVTASCRSETGWFFLLFSGFWNAITWSVGLAMIFSGDSGDLVAVLFMIPFMLIGIGTAIAALVGLWGRVRVRVGREDGEVFLGLLGRGVAEAVSPRGGDGGGAGGQRHEGEPRGCAAHRAEVPGRRREVRDPPQGAEPELRVRCPEAGVGSLGTHGVSWVFMGRPAGRKGIEGTAQRW